MGRLGYSEKRQDCPGGLTSPYKSVSGFAVPAPGKSLGWLSPRAGRVSEGVEASKRELDCGQQEHGGQRGPAELCLGILMPIQEI